MNIIILGATKGIGRALARATAERGDRIVLLGRDQEDLERSAEDLKIRTGRTDAASSALCDLEKLEQVDPALDQAWSALGHVDAVIVTAGLFATQERLEGEPAFARRLLDVNFTATVMFCEAARKRLLAQPNGGTLCVLSSVAGDRARKPVVIYGASKAGLTAYLNGLDHKFRSAGLVTICVKPGFVKTGMTAGLKPPPFAGEPEQVAQDILKAIQNKCAEVYTPAMWRLVMAVIKRLPRFVMRRIGF